MKLIETSKKFFNTGLSNNPTSRGRRALPNCRMPFKDAQKLLSYNCMHSSKEYSTADNGMQTFVFE